MISVYDDEAGEVAYCTYEGNGVWRKYYMSDEVADAFTVSGTREAPQVTVSPDYADRLVFSNWEFLTPVRSTSRNGLEEY